MLNEGNDFYDSGDLAAGDCRSAIEVLCFVQTLAMAKRQLPAVVEVFEEYDLSGDEH